MIIDSGTTLTMLPPKLYNEFVAVLKDAINVRTVEDPQKVLSLCYRDSKVTNVPKVMMHFEGADAELSRDNIFVRCSIISFGLLDQVLWFYLSGDNCVVFGLTDSDSVVALAGSSGIKTRPLHGSTGRVSRGPPFLPITTIGGGGSNSKEIAGLMLMSMEPEIQRNLEPLHAHEMLKELKTLFAQQAEQELLQTTRDFHSCRQEEGQSNYNMHNTGKTVNELHAMLKLHEKTLPKSNAPALNAI
nr:zinc finger, CCHC-type [Tanacetum cinerariifolium]